MVCICERGCRFTGPSIHPMSAGLTNRSSVSTARWTRGGKAYVPENEFGFKLPREIFQTFESEYLNSNTS